MKNTLPKDFLWGGAIAANQCEGAYLEGEKVYHQLIFYLVDQS